MIVDERFTTYVAFPGGAGRAASGADRGRRRWPRRVPIIRKETQSFLKTLPCDPQSPARVLEIGTAVGVFRASDERLSARRAGTSLPSRTMRSEYPHCQGEFPAQAGKEGQIRLIPGNALAVMKELGRRPYDLIFM